MYDCTRNYINGAWVASEGGTLHDIASHRFGDPAVLQAAGRLLRAVIAHHLGGRELRSRKVLLELHRGRIARSETDTEQE